MRARTFVVPSKTFGNGRSDQTNEQNKEEVARREYLRLPARRITHSAGSSRSTARNRRASANHKTSGLLEQLHSYYGSAELGDLYSDKALLMRESLKVLLSKYENRLRYISSQVLPSRSVFYLKIKIHTSSTHECSMCWRRSSSLSIRTRME